MENGKAVDYLQAVRVFDKAHGKKPEGFDIPLRSSEELPESVDYLSVMQKYEQFLNTDQLEVIYNGKCDK